MRPVPAGLQTAVEAQTQYGGRTSTWTTVAVVWLTLERSFPRRTEGGDRPPATTETAFGRARGHPLLATGSRLQAGPGAPWTVRAVLPDAPGRVRLDLER